ncbi:hypothetical protein ETD86_26365 [Nonomuraea turkmeniaca]|uniref:Insertion element IS402-like domain-containing protein n=1 Tax=Nonomuraea turkmeniaca TaxID=103838 RepID=A0A5S4FCQ6_9ACTN|nr:hypothetical protein ETD86_26365 [Nonomuraea turkmeniaca]
MWEVAVTLMPARRRRRQGGGRAATDARTVLGAVVSVLTSGCAWQHLPAPSMSACLPRTAGSSAGPGRTCGRACARPRWTIPGWPTGPGRSVTVRHLVFTNGNHQKRPGISSRVRRRGALDQSGMEKP